MKRKKQMPCMGMLSTSDDTSKKAVVILFFIVFFVVVMAFVFSLQAQVLPVQKVISEKGKIPKQEKNFRIGTGLVYQVSGNGHGISYSPYLSLSTQQFSGSIGLIIQKRTMNIVGAKFSFSRNLTGKYFLDQKNKNNIRQAEECSLMLSTFMYGQYTHNARLGYRAEKIETRTQISDDIQWNQTKLCTYEAGMGFEIHLRLMKQLYLKNFIGAAFYYHTCCPDNLYRDKISTMLIIGSGIDIPSFK